MKVNDDIKNDPEFCDHDWGLDTYFSERDLFTVKGHVMIAERKIYYCKKCDTYKKVTKLYDVHEDTEL